MTEGCRSEARTKCDFLPLINMVSSKQKTISRHECIIIHSCSASPTTDYHAIRSMLVATYTASHEDHIRARAVCAQRLRYSSTSVHCAVLPKAMHSQVVARALSSERPAAAREGREPGEEMASLSSLLHVNCKRRIRFRKHNYSLRF